MTLRATSSWPSPMDTFSQGNFFFFLASSSIEEVGSAPAERRNKTGSSLELSCQMESMGYEMGAVNSLPTTALMNCVAATSVRSSRSDLTKHKEMKDPISFSAEILSAKSGIAKFSGSLRSIHVLH